MLHQSLHSLLFLRHSTHIHASSVAKILALAVQSWSILMLCGKTNRLSSSGGHQPDQSEATKLSQLLQLVWACLDQPGIWLRYIWRRPSSGATLHSEANFLKDWWGDCVCEQEDVYWLDLSSLRWTYPILIMCSLTFFFLLACCLNAILLVWAFYRLL